MAKSSWCTILASVLALCLVGVASAQPAITAPWAYDPPVTDKSAIDALLHPLPQTVVTGYLARRGVPVVYDAYAGMNDDLAATFAEAGKVEKVALGMELDLTSDGLFTSSFTEGGRNVYVGQVTSVDAVALRASLDLSGLAQDDELWVVDPTGPRAFGPYGVSDAGDAGRWTPTVQGDSIVFVAKSATAVPPQMSVTAVSHFFKQFDSTLPCNINIACETDAAIQTLSTGVGFMVFVENGIDQAVCSGMLINNPDTPAREPYFMTANHCVANQSEANQVEVIWDHRATDCGSNNSPDLVGLPRTESMTLLSTNNLLDMTLLRLSSVPPGTNGRAYAGYTTQPVSVGTQVFAMHHPQGSHMRITYGVVRAVDVSSFPWERQTEVLWTEGVTEGGSSGSGLFTADTYLYIGCLSNGPLHDCVDTSGNKDNFATFRLFFTQAGAWLAGTNPPETPDGGVIPIDCPAKAAYGPQSRALAHLRAFRDNVLMASGVGRMVVAKYYEMAPVVAKWVQDRPEARSAFVVASMPFAGLGEALPVAAR